MNQDRPAPGEADDIDAVVAASQQLLDDSDRPVRRGQHAKMHGLVAARFVVESSLGDEHRVGLFAEPGREYRAWVRFSNGSKVDDRDRDAHGMAIKLVGVPGRKVLPEEADAATHDFVLVDHPSFFIRDAAEYAKLSRAMVRAAGRGDARPPLARRLLVGLSDPARMLATLVLTFFFPFRLATLARLIAFAGARPASPLRSRYWSTTPYRFGADRAVKYAVRPEAGGLADPPADPRSRTADYLRQAMVSELAGRDAVFIFQAQFAGDGRGTPIEDPTVEWDERVAPPVTLARLIIPRQEFDTATHRAFGEHLSFTPWHALPEHEPLGGINRCRREVYAKLSRRRHEANGVPMREPGVADRPGHPVPRPRVPSGFGQVLEGELERIHDRRATLFGPIPPSVPFRPQPDEDCRIRRARHRSLTDGVMALSFSGGGIRSGTFAVGFLQGLGALGVLKRFDYLSTVSGGGYAGGWFAAWALRDGSIRDVERQLDGDRRAQGRVDRREIHREVVDLEPEPLRHLRAYSSYLFPQPGLLKPDTWTVLMIWLRNVLINFGMLLPMALGAVAVARLLVLLFGRANRGWIVQDGPSGGAAWAVGLAFAAATVGLALLSLARGTRALDEFRFRDPSYRPEDPGAGRILVPAGVAAVLVTVFLRWALWQVGAALDGAAGRPSEFVARHLPARFAWDYLATHLGLLDPPNILLHVAVVGLPMALLAARAARRSHARRDDEAAVDPPPGRSRPSRRRDRATPRRGQAGAFARAAGVAGGLMAVLIVLLEVLIRHLGAVDRPDLMAALAPPAAFLILVAGMIAQVAMLGRAIGEAEREWWARLSALLALAAVAWAGTMATILHLPGLIYAAGGSARAALASGWLGTATLAVLSGRYVLPKLRGRLGGLSVAFVASVAAVAFLAGFAALVALLGAAFINTPALADLDALGAGTYGYYLDGVVRAGPVPILLVGLGSILLYSLAARLVDVNLFSLHAMYADRLVRCYLGASRPLAAWADRWDAPRDPRVPSGAPSLGPIGRGFADARPRDPSPVTGFDPADDLPLFDLAIGAARPGHARPFEGPHLLINATLNLVEGHDLAWRDRKGESFTLSPLYCGSKGVGFAELDIQSRHHMTLGRAMAISGAAVDPNMSFYQSASLTALLTLFNARLGCWVARPRPARWAAAGPRFGDLLLTEFLGRTDGSRDYVHLSDGGHFENLGVYELVRRRCRYVVAVDAGSDGDPADDNLANLVRLCRIDFGVAIDVDTASMRRVGPDGLARAHFAVGRINYKAVDADFDDGVLVYVKISLTGDEPADVAQYARANPDFPHQATDYRQAFDEAQFESYRCLGAHIARDVFAAIPAALLADDVTPTAEYAERVFGPLVPADTTPPAAEADAPPDDPAPAEELAPAGEQNGSPR